MFRQTRLKLTGWYLLIIMAVSLAFSLVIYRVIGSEVDRFAQTQRLRIERRFRLGEFAPFPDTLSPDSLPLVPIMDPELIEETKRRLMLILVLVNGGILFIAGGLGYILAGKTLQPIKSMLDEQNRFITDSSHEFRTPLTSLKSALDVNLRDPHLTLKGAKTVITDSIQDVNKLQALSDELLQLTQYQKPNGSSQFAPLSLADVAKAALRQVKPLAKAKHITLKNQIKNLKITGNKYGLTDLLVILLDNAIKYSSSSQKVTLTSAKTNSFVTISVKDRGMGIDQKDIPHIFDRFYRTDTARSKTTTGGYGLGLSIAQKIVAAHHGSIAVKSLPGKGSTFTVKLPVSFSSLSALGHKLSTI